MKFTIAGLDRNQIRLFHYKDVSKYGPMDDSRIAVKVSNVSITLQGNRILEDVSIDCPVGEWTLIYGVSGCGKTTLLRAINGLCVPDFGCIWTLGTPIPGRTHTEARATWRQTGTVLQEVALFETKNALDNVLLALHTVGVDRRLAREEAVGWLERLNIGDKLHEFPAHLSGGERQRVALARAFATRPRLLLMDEPTSALDQATAEVVMAAVKELVGQGTTVIMSNHRLSEVAEFCHQRIGLARGRVMIVDRRGEVGDSTVAQGEVRQGDGRAPLKQEVTAGIN